MPKFMQGYMQSRRLTKEQCDEIVLRSRNGEKRRVLRYEYGLSDKRMTDILAGRYTGEDNVAT